MTQDKIVLVGDIHGMFATLNWLIHDRYKLQNTHIIQVGDFGAGFYKPNYYRTEWGALNESLEENNNILYAIHGNHDDPFYFQETNHPFGYKNIKLLTDYTTITLLGSKFLFVGGATSIDRTDPMRVQGKTFWAGEEFQFLPDFPYEKNYDVVVTHSRPLVSGAFLSQDRIRYWLEQDKSLKVDLETEGLELNKLYDVTKPKYFCYGHFHASDYRVHENTVFKCLDINEFWELPI